MLIAATTVITAGPVGAEASNPSPAAVTSTSAVTSAKPVTPTTGVTSTTKSTPVPTTVAAGGGGVRAAATTTTVPASTTTSTLPGSTPALTVTPSEGLHDLEMVTVSGSGYVPGEAVGLAQCLLFNGLIGGICYGATRTDVTADPSGGFATSMVVRRIISESVNTADCAAAPGTCGIVAGRTGPAVVAALTFDRSVPVAGPVLDVQPGADLHDGDRVQVRGVGFTPSAKIVIAQCPAATFALTACDKSTQVSAQSDSTGAFVTSFVVHATIAPAGTSGEAATLVDCRFTSCKVAAANSLGASEHADAAIEFAPSVVQAVELPGTGAPSRTLSILGGTLLILGASVLAGLGARRRHLGRRPG
ncbi:MAG: neocarzinostatin apoprotein domain-containing protein [Acidimicrobiales bacterium]